MKEKKIELKSSKDVFFVKDNKGNECFIVYVNGEFFLDNNSVFSIKKVNNEYYIVSNNEFEIIYTKYYYKTYLRYDYYNNIDGFVIYTNLKNNVLNENMVIIYRNNKNIYMYFFKYSGDLYSHFDFIKHNLNKFKSVKISYFDNDINVYFYYNNVNKFFKIEYCDLRLRKKDGEVESIEDPILKGNYIMSYNNYIVKYIWRFGGYYKYVTVDDINDILLKDKKFKFLKDNIFYTIIKAFKKINNLFYIRFFRLNENNLEIGEKIFINSDITNIDFDFALKESLNKSQKYYYK